MNVVEVHSNILLGQCSLLIFWATNFVLKSWNNLFYCLLGFAGEPHLRYMERVTNYDASLGREVTFWQCRLCSYNSNKNTNVIEHVYSRHMESQNIPCNYCGTVLKHMPAFKRHLKKCSRIFPRIKNF